MSKLTEWRWVLHWLRFLLTSLWVIMNNIGYFKKSRYQFYFIGDMFMIFLSMFKTSEQADKFLDFLNSRHKNIKFTIKKEQDQKLPFLNVLITKSSNNRITTNYKKSKDTGLLTNYLTFISTRYKLGL